jgi:SAM-dependent methyltransferase
MPDGAGRTWDPKTTFDGTPFYYARYRPRYPAEAFAVLREKFDLTGSSRVLDLGCGPGSLALPLASIAGRVYAVDPNGGMLAEAQRLAKERGIENIDWFLAESRDLPELAKRIGPVDLTVMGRSFHWMDGARTLRDLYELTALGGGVALLADGNVAASRDAPTAPKGGNPPVPEPPAWRRFIVETTRKWLGEERKAGTSGTYAHPRKHHLEVVADSEFTRAELVQLKYQRTWNVEQILGYLYSTSSNSIPVLGENKDAFEADVRERLLAAEPTGTFTEPVTVQLILAWKRAD